MKRIMVCVTLQNTCESLIRRASLLRETEDDLLFVLHVAKNGQKLMGKNNDAAALEYLYGVSARYGASMTVLRSDDISETIVSFMKEHEITAAVLGTPGENEKDAGLARDLPSRVPCEYIFINRRENT